MATDAQVQALISAICSRADIASDESRIALGSASSPDVVNPEIGGTTIPGTYPRGTALGNDSKGARVFKALVQGLADYFLQSAIPSKTILLANLSPTERMTYFDPTGMGIVGSWIGFALCNGNNGTPDLSGKFPRMTTSGSGGTGGSDTAATHTHLLPIGFDASTFYADYGKVTPQQISSGIRVTTPGTYSVSGPITVQYTDADGSHDNRPAYYELVSVMKL